MSIGKSVPIYSMKRRLGRVASHDVTKRLEKLDARPLEGHFAMRLLGRLARDIRSRWKTSRSKVIFGDFIATGRHLLSSRRKEKWYSAASICEPLRLRMQCDAPRLSIAMHHENATVLCYDYVNYLDCTASLIAIQQSNQVKTITHAP